MAHGKAWLTGGVSPDGPIPVSYASTALMVFAKHDSEAAYPLLKEAIQARQTQLTKDTYSRTHLCRWSDVRPASVEFESMGLRSNEIVGVLVRNGAKPENSDAAWAWLQENAASVKTKVPAWHFSWMPWMASRPCSVEQEEAVRELFEPLLKDVAGGERSLKKVQESMSQCRELNGRVAKALEAALKRRASL